LAITFHASPERFGAHAYDHVIWFSRHNTRNRIAYFLPHLPQQCLKRCIITEILIADVNA
jgi:hypothetical protein